MNRAEEKALEMKARKRTEKEQAALDRENWQEQGQYEKYLVVQVPKDRAFPPEAQWIEVQGRETDQTITWFRVSEEQGVGLSLEEALEKTGIAHGIEVSDMVIFYRTEGPPPGWPLEILIPDPIEQELLETRRTMQENYDDFDIMMPRLSTPQKIEGHITHILQEVDDIPADVRQRIRKIRELVTILMEEYEG